VNVLTHEIEGVDIAVQGYRIVSVGKADKLVGKETSKNRGPSGGSGRSSSEGFPHHRTGDTWPCIKVM